MVANHPHIGGNMHLNHEPMSPVFDKWHVEGLPTAAVFHRFSEVDHGDPHDHPWGFTSFVIHGGYVEQVFQLDGSVELIHRKVGESFYIPAQHIHRLVELPAGECTTIILPGPHEQTSGFYQFRPDGAYHRFWDQPDFQRMAA